LELLNDKRFASVIKTDEDILNWLSAMFTSKSYGFTRIPPKDIVAWLKRPASGASSHDYLPIPILDGFMLLASDNDTAYLEKFGTRLKEFAQKSDSKTVSQLKLFFNHQWPAFIEAHKEFKNEKR
jgi:hypothetical protein